MSKAQERAALRQRQEDARENRGYYRCKLLENAPVGTQGRLRALLVCGMLVFEREVAAHLQQHGIEGDANPMQYFELVSPTMEEAEA